MGWVLRASQPTPGEGAAFGFSLINIKLSQASLGGGWAPKWFFNVPWLFFKGFLYFLPLPTLVNEFSAGERCWIDRPGNISPQGAMFWSCEGNNTVCNPDLRVIIHSNSCFLLEIKKWRPQGFIRTSEMFSGGWSIGHGQSWLNTVSPHCWGTQGHVSLFNCCFHFKKCTFFSALEHGLNVEQGPQHLPAQHSL